MTVTVETPIASSVANGVTTVFPHSFTLLDEADLVVTGDDGSGSPIAYTLGADYTVSGVGSSSGTVTFLVAPASGIVVTRYRDTSLSRQTDYQQAGDLLASVVNADFDRLWQVLQEIFGGGKGVVNALRVPNGETIPALGNASARALKIQAYDSNGDPLLIDGVDPGSAASLALDLADATNVAKGDGQIAVKRTATGAVATTQHAVNERAVFSVFDFMSASDVTAVRARTPTNSAVAAVQAAVDAANAAGGGVVLLPAGKYKFSGTQSTLNNDSRLNDGVTLYSDITIQGEDDTEIALDIATTPCCTAFTGRLRSAVTSSANNLHDIHFRNIKFTRGVATFFQEQLTIFLDSCERFSVKDCKFIGWSGDAIMLGGILNSTAGAFLQSIIKDGEISGCLFDGVNNDTRQAISLFCGENVDIHDNVFKNTTRSDMPGAIDIEPELATDIVRNIRVHHNTFSNCGGFGGVIGAALSFNLSTTADGISFDNNIIHGCPNTYALGITGRVGATSTTVATNAPTNIDFRDNLVIGVPGVGAAALFLARGVNGIRIVGNVVRSSRVICDLGLPSSGPTHYPLANLVMANTYIGCRIQTADATLPLIYISGCVKGAHIADKFIDSGNWNAAGTVPTNMRAYSIDSAPGQDSSYLHFDRCSFNSAGNAYASGVSPFYCPGTLSAPTTVLVTDPQYIGIAPDDEANSSILRQAQFNVRKGSAVYDPPNLVAAAIDTEQSITVTGAALGDEVRASFSLDLQGLRLDAYVSAANTVKFRFSNPTAGAVNLGSGTVTVRLRR